MASMLKCMLAFLFVVTIDLSFIFLFRLTLGASLYVNAGSVSPDAMIELRVSTLGWSASWPSSSNIPIQLERLLHD